MGADTAYQFSHALLREAAYQLQLPSSRALLHAAAHDLLLEEPEFRDALAFDLAEHARLALADPELPEHLRSRLRLAEPRHLANAAAVARRDFRNADAKALLLRLSSHEAASPRQRADALVKLGITCITLGQNDQAPAYIRQGIQWSESEPLGVRAGMLVEAATALGVIHRIEDVEAICAQAAPLAEAGGGLDVQVDLLIAWSIARQQQQQWQSAGEMLQRALTIAQEGHDPKRILAVRSNLGILAMHLGQNAEAERILQEVIKEASAAHDLSLLCTATGNLGNVRNKQRRYEEGRLLLLQGIELAQQLGDRRRELVHLGNLVTSVKQLGERRQGRVLGAEALNRAREAGNLHSVAINAGNLAVSLHEEHYYDEAFGYYLEALNAAKGCGALSLVALWQVHLSLLGTLSSDHELEQHYRELARQTYHSLGQKLEDSIYPEAYRSTLAERQLIDEIESSLHRQRET